MPAGRTAVLLFALLQFGMVSLLPLCPPPGLQLICSIASPAVVCCFLLQLQVPDTPEEEGLAAAADLQQHAQQHQQPQQQANSAGDALLRQALRRSAEKARSADATGTAAPASAAAAPAPSTAQLQPAAGPPAVQAGGAPPSAAALTRDLTNQPRLAAPTSAALAAAVPSGQAGAAPPLRSVPLPPQLGAGGPVPLAQHQRQQQPASFLAGARAALQEASAGGAQQAPPPAQQVQQPPGSLVPLQPPLQQAVVQPGHAPQLPLHRSPHADGAGLLPAPMPVAAPADRTPQALQLGLERTPGAEAGAPPSGKTDGGASFVSGGCCLPSILRERAGLLLLPLRLGGPTGALPAAEPRSNAILQNVCQVGRSSFQASASKAVLMLLK